MAKTHEITPEKPAKSSGWPLLAVQSISCGVMLLITLLFRLAGGEAYAGLQSAFGEAIEEEGVIAVLASLLDEDEPDEVKTVTPTTSATATTSTATKPTLPDGVKAVSAPVAQPPKGFTYAKLTFNRPAGLPVEDGQISSGYGYRDNPTGSGEQFHGGVDIAAEEGKRIGAMYFGVVIDTGESSSYGKYIQIYHGNGVEVLYAHCSAIKAEIGQAVQAGDTVALVGATGDVTGPHVHIEVIKDGVTCDPSALLPDTLHA